MLEFCVLQKLSKYFILAVNYRVQVLDHSSAISLHVYRPTLFSIITEIAHGPDVESDVTLRREMREHVTRCT